MCKLYEVGLREGLDANGFCFFVREQVDPVVRGIVGRDFPSKDIALSFALSECSNVGGDGLVEYKWHGEYSIHFYIPGAVYNVEHLGASDVRFDDLIAPRPNSLEDIAIPSLQAALKNQDGVQLKHALKGCEAEDAAKVAMSDALQREDGDKS